MSIARRLFLIAVAVLTGFAVTAADIAPVSAEIVLAQRAQRQPTFLERMFGLRGPPPTIRQQPQRIFRKKQPTVRKSVEPAVPAIVVEAKDPNARKILVVGDYVGTGIAWGLDQALAKETRLAVLDRTEGASGLVRTDHYDWGKELLGILNAEKPDIVVVAFGTNDRQQIRLDGKRLSMRTPQWEETYIRRVDGIVDTLKVYGRPFFWVSAPPMRTNAVSADMAWLNTLYKPRATAAGGYFVDVWNGFTNANGQFVASGPDIDGQVRALRNSDGINFTRAGRQKLAYYVEREIRRQTGVGAGAVDLLASTSQTSQIEIGPDGRKRLVGPIISLTEPLPGAVEIGLAGAPPPLVYDPVSGTTRVVAVPSPLLPPPAEQQVEETPLHRLVVNGEPLAAAAGRVDDFTWPPGQRASQTFVNPIAAAEAAAAARATAVAGTVPIPVARPN